MKLYKFRALDANKQVIEKEYMANDKTRAIVFGKTQARMMKVTIKSFFEMQADGKFKKF